MEKYSIHDTALVPYLIAERVAGYDNKEAVDYLENKAETIYQHSKHFRDSINDKRKDSRDTLAMFMAHWLQGFKKKATKQ